MLIPTGEPVEIGAIEKMSKSKRNTVDPDEIIGTYGADTARWFMLSDSPPERDVSWTEEGVQGAWRFAQRLWRLVGEIADVAKAPPAARPEEFGPPPSRCARPRTARSPKSRTRSKSSISMSASPISTSSPARYRPHSRARQRARRFPRSRLGAARGGRHPGSALPSDDAAPGRRVLAGPRTRYAGRRSSWPVLEPELLIEDTIVLPVQVNGKKRADVTVGRNAGTMEVESAVLALEAVRRALDGKRPKKVIVVPQRIVNVVA